MHRVNSVSEPKNVHKLGQWFGSATLAFCLSTSVLAQSYPSQPVKILLPYAAG